VRGCLSIAAPILILFAIGIYSAFPHPTHDQATLKLVATEAQHLLATRRLSPKERSIVIQKDQWPPAIATLKPYSVIVRPGMVDVATKPFFDGAGGMASPPTVET